MKYGLALKDVETYRFKALLEGLMFKDDTPFGYIVMVRSYKGDLHNKNKEYHKRLMKDKLRFALKLSPEEKAQNLKNFAKFAQLFEEKKV